MHGFPWKGNSGAAALAVGARVEEDDGARMFVHRTFNCPRVGRVLRDMHRFHDLAVQRRDETRRLVAVQLHDEIGKDVAGARNVVTRGLTKTPTGVIKGGRFAAMCFAALCAIRRGDAAKIMPIASAPVSTASITSWRSVQPQNLMRVLTPAHAPPF